MGTPFTTVYNRFLGRITDDMYLELTPQDTIKDLQNLLLDAISEFEFPRKVLTNYTIQVEYCDANIILDGINPNNVFQIDNNTIIVDNSSFEEELSTEEIGILATLMMIAWLQRQITSIEHIRMKYSSADFKMTSQANHLAKLLTLLKELQRQSMHAQRLYKRRRIGDNGGYESNWSVLGANHAIDY